jgi:hypothetical protein
MEYGFGSEGWRLRKISRSNLYARSERGGSVNNFAEQPYAVPVGEPVEGAAPNFEN